MPYTTGIDDLCDSLLIDIFSRLPLRSMKRVTAVSKRWNALSSDLHRQFTQRKLIAFFFFYLGDTLFVTANSRCPRFLLSNLVDPRFRVVASYKDLVLFCKASWSLKVLYVWNPITTQWIPLPSTPSTTRHHPRLYSGCPVGFIYEDGILIVLLILIQSCDALVVQSFTSVTHAWTERVEKVVYSGVPRGSWPSFSPKQRNGIPYNGLLFWNCVSRGLIGFDPYSGGKFARLIGPPLEFRKDGYMNNAWIGVCNGSLKWLESPWEYHRNLQSSFVRIWDLKNYETGEWYLERKVSLNTIISPIYPGTLFESPKHVRDYLKVLACDPNDPRIIYFLSSLDPEVSTHKPRSWCRIMSCNLDTGAVEHVRNIRKSDGHFNDDNFYYPIAYELQWSPTPIPCLEEFQPIGGVL